MWSCSLLLQKIMLNNHTHQKIQSFSFHLFSFSSSLHSSHNEAGNWKESKLIIIMLCSLSCLHHHYQHNIIKKGLPRQLQGGGRHNTSHSRVRLSSCTHIISSSSCFSCPHHHPSDQLFLSCRRPLEYILYLHDRCKSCRKKVKWNRVHVGRRFFVSFSLLCSFSSRTKIYACGYNIGFVVLSTILLRND